MDTRRNSSVGGAVADARRQVDENRVEFVLAGDVSENRSRGLFGNGSHANVCIDARPVSTFCSVG